MTALDQSGPGSSKSGYVDVGDLSMYYEEQGTGSPLVLIHGGLATGDMMWADRVPDLAQRYRVLVPDSRGHGRTNNPSGKLSYSRMADDVTGFMEALGVPQALVLGYSDGAQIGLELGLRHPARIKALVLGGAVTRPTRRYLAALQVMGFTEPGQVDFDQFERIYPEFFAMIKTAHQHVYGPEYWRSFLPQISELWLGVPSYADEQLAGIGVPSLIITGDRDEGDSLDESLRLYRTLPHAELSVIPNADHAAIASPLFWGAVEDFLARNA
ncbi:MAG TPA: alpha/beta hydrolase [Roseiflexaceae bacterium]|nr:alpha/beta hydrolase [Roseiflexaceae bacterium]